MFIAKSSRRFLYRRNLLQVSTGKFISFDRCQRCTIRGFRGDAAIVTISGIEGEFMVIF